MTNYSISGSPRRKENLKKNSFLERQMFEMKESVVYVLFKFQSKSKLCLFCSAV